MNPYMPLQAMSCGQVTVKIPAQTVLVIVLVLLLLI